MNLFFNPSLTELRKLFHNLDDSSEHNIVVDFDGEVLVDPEKELPQISLDKFKVRMKLSSLPKDAISRSSKFLNRLLNHLVNDWNKLSGYNNPATN